MQELNSDDVVLKVRQVLALADEKVIEGPLVGHILVKELTSFGHCRLNLLWFTG